MKGITVESFPDPVWAEWQKVKKNYPNLKPPGIRTGKYQYVYSSSKGRVSLMFEHRRITFGRRTAHEKFWEIFCLEGDLFEGPERFLTRAGAEKRIAGLLL